MAADSRPIPRLKEPHWLGSLPEFRRSRVEFQRYVMDRHPEIASVRFGIFDVLVVGSPALVHEVLVAQADAFVKSYGLSLFARPILGDGLLTSEQAFHRRQRRLIAPALAQRRIAAYADVMAERAEQAIQRMLGQAEVDILDQSLRVTLEIVGKTLFGAELAGSASHIGSAVTDAMECVMDTMTAALPVPPLVPTPTNLKLRRAVERLDQVVYQMIRERRTAHAAQDDLLSLLMAARDETDGTGMSDRQLRDEVMTAFLAGHETTAVVLVWALVLLAKHPEVRARVEVELDGALGGKPPAAADLERIPLTLRVVKESLRLYPPAYLLGRRALRATRIDGYPVRKDQVVLLCTYGMQRRADLFAEPQRFDPDRFLPERERALPRHAFSPFGAGPRMCVGNHFALMEAHLILASWLQRARLELLAPADEVAFDPLITLRPKPPLRMRVSAR